MKVWQCCAVLVALLCNMLGAAGQRLFVSRDEFVQQQQQWQQQQQPRRSLRAVVDLPGVPGYSAPAYYAPSVYGTPDGLVPYYSAVSGRRLSSSAGDVWPAPAPELAAGRHLKEYGAVVTYAAAAVYSASLPLYSAATPLPYYSPVVAGRRLSEVRPMPPVPLFAAHEVPKPRQILHGQRSLQAAAAPAPAAHTFLNTPVVTGADTRGAPRTLLQAYYTAQPYSAYPPTYSPVVITQAVYAPALYAAAP